MVFEEGQQRREGGVLGGRSTARATARRRRECQTHVAHGEQAAVEEEEDAEEGEEEAKGRQAEADFCRGGRREEAWRARD